MTRNPASIECRAQMRAHGVTLDRTAKPIVASRPFDPTAVHDPEAARNAQRMAMFHARWHGQSESRLQLWSA